MMIVDARKDDGVFSRGLRFDSRASDEYNENIGWSIEKTMGPYNVPWMISR